eukprot:gene15106-23079_t
MAGVFPFGSLASGGVQGTAGGLSQKAGTAAPAGLAELSVQSVSDTHSLHSSASAVSDPAPIVAPAARQTALFTVVVEFRFRRCGVFGTGEQFAVGGRVLVETARGQDVGTVLASSTGPPNSRKSRANHAPENASAPNNPKATVRVATEAEVALWERNIADEPIALNYIREQVHAHKIPIDVHGAEYQFDRRKLTFHYSSSLKRPPFQTLLHDGYRRFRCRIWMNNCQPTGSDPGEPIDSLHFVNQQKLAEQLLDEKKSADQQNPQEETRLRSIENDPRPKDILALPLGPIYLDFDDREADDDSTLAL